MWWEDPTHFKMSLLFVWPAAIFSLLIWWTFFSGWSWTVRLGALGLGFGSLVAFFAFFRLDRFDGDMMPTRIRLRTTASADQKSREYLRQLASTSAAKPEEVQADKPLEADETDWIGFRGANRDGIVRHTKLRTDWDAKPPKLVWRHPVGKGWSSFAVVGDFAFTQEQREGDEAIVAYRLSSGEQLWTHIDSARFVATDAQGGSGPRATPQFDEGKLYVLGATGILNCLDARTGDGIWSRQILTDAGTPDKPAANLEWGLSESPLIVGNLVIVIPGGPNGHSVAAYDKLTGKPVWSAGSRPATYASPVVATLCGQRVFLAPLGTGVSANSLETGDELWFFPWTNGPKVCGAMPVVLDDKSVLFGIGYGEGTVRLNVERSGDSWSVTRTWHSNRFRPKFNDFVIREGHAYGLDDGTLTCLDIETGKIKWKSGRYGYGQLLLVDDLLLIVAEAGTVSLVPAVPEKRDVIASFAALSDEIIAWNQPVLVRGKLLLRNATEAACYDLE